MTPPVTVTFTKSEWPYTRTQVRQVVLEPGEVIRGGNGWLIAEVSYHAPGEKHTARLLNPATDVDPEAEREVAQAMKAKAEEPQWLTWPPERQLEEGHEYLVKTRIGQQKYDRMHRMSFVGKTHIGLMFNARPFAGTQHFQVSNIIATKDLGKSKGRDDPERFMNRSAR